MGSVERIRPAALVASFDKSRLSDVYLASIGSGSVDIAPMGVVSFAPINKGRIVQSAAAYRAGLGAAISTTSPVGARSRQNRAL
jgi:hypothetical protein